jgi:hypothetical protein
MIDQEHPSDPKLEYLRERYAFADWSDAGTPPESLFIWQYVRNRHDLPGYELERIEEIETERERPASIRALWRSQSDRVAVLELLVSECPDRGSARPALLRTLGQFQAFLERREGVGDVAFAAARDGAVTFVVANLVLLVRMVDGPPTPVTGPARDVERNVRARPDPGGRVAPEIHELAAGAPQPDGTVPITVKTADPLGRPLWFKVFGHGGEAFDRDGDLAFRPFGPEPWDVTVFAINENGGAAERALSAPER